jgi:hypothetical protein
MNESLHEWLWDWSRALPHWNFRPADWASLLNLHPIFQADLVEDMLFRARKDIDEFIFSDVLIANAAVSLHVYNILHSCVFLRHIDLVPSHLPAATVIEDEKKTENRY